MSITCTSKTRKKETQSIHILYTKLLHRGESEKERTFHLFSGYPLNPHHYYYYYLYIYMKFSCTQENLQRAIATIAHLASKNTHLPILRNVLLIATEAGVDLVTTDLEIVLRVHMRAKVEKKGMFTVPAAIFFGYIQLVKTERIDIELIENEIVLHAGENKTKIKGQSADEFPPLPEKISGLTIHVPSQELQQAMKKTIVAVSTDQSRPELTALFFSVDDGKIYFVATDTYRLAEKKVFLQKQEEQKKVSLLLPAPAVQEMSRIFNGIEEDVEIIISENQVHCSSNEIEMTTRIIEGEFPDYTQVIPQQHRTRILVDTQECINAIKASSVFTRTGIFDINVHVSKEESVLTFTSVNTQLGENITKIHCTVEGDSNNIVFNYKYVLDALGNINTPQTEIRFIDNEQPAIFIPVLENDQETASYLHLIMPIKP